MKLLPVVLTTIGFINLVSPQPTYAQTTQCMDRERGLAILGEQFGERAVGLGVVNERTILEVFVNAETGTWSVVMTDDTLKSCLVASGANWQDLVSNLPPNL